MYKEPGTDTFVPYIQQIFHYTTATRLLDTMWEQQYFDTGFVYSEKTVTAYNARGKVVSETKYVPVDPAWEGVDRTEYFYDATDTLIQRKVISYWYNDGTTQTWVKNDQYVYLYTASAVGQGSSAPPAAVGRLDYMSAGRGAVIRFSVPAASRVSLALYDLRGNLIKRLLDNALVSGEQSVAWDGTNRGAAVAAQGVCVCRLSTRAGTLTRQLVLAK
jgi:hypothetical protein